MSFLFLHSPPFFVVDDFAVVFPSIGPHAFRPDSMKLRKSIPVLAVAAVALFLTAATLVKADVEELMDGFGQDYANEPGSTAVPSSTGPILTTSASNNLSSLASN
jgi:hypothetical protein